jgi:hypothetical protein
MSWLSRMAAMFGVGRIFRHFARRAIRSRQAGKSGLGGKDGDRSHAGSGDSDRDTGVLASEPDCAAADSAYRGGHHHHRGAGQRSRSQGLVERQGKMATAKKAASSKAADREAEDAPKDDEKDDEDVGRRSQATSKPPVQGGKDPNQNDDDDMTFSIKGNRISVELENDDRAPDTLRSFADLVDGLG